MPAPLLFAWRAALTQSDLPATARLVAFALSTHMDNDGSNAWPSLKTLAREAGIHQRNVRKYLRCLEREGWLLVEPSTGGRGKTSTNRWKAHIPHRSREGASARGVI